MALVYLAALPARGAGLLNGWGALSTRLNKFFLGGLVDAAAVVWWVLVPTALVALVLPLLLRGLRTASWQARGAGWSFVFFGFVFCGLSITAQEVKAERGSFPTVFDFHEGASNSSVVETSLGYLTYQRIWLPLLVGVLLAAVVLWRMGRNAGAPLAWRPWAAGIVSGLFGGALVLTLLASGLAHAKNEFTPAYLGDPMTVLLESTVDVVLARGQATPRELVLSAELPREDVAKGEARLGWPATQRRPLDWAQEPPTKDPRGRALLEALSRVSHALFDGLEGNPVVWQLSLEGFRSDDVAALNPEAPREIAPFTSSLYERTHGTLASRRMFQGGVRTAHCLAAMTCGLGTLPYNLSLIRDLQPVDVRCMPDVLHDAGFEASFFYGADPSFDEMRRFLEGHGFAHVVSQPELPKTLPRGTWDALTDFVIFDEAVKRVNERAPRGPQFALVMSLSNHSPFTTPEDLPAAVTERVDAALRNTKNHADQDDRLRLVTFSYTDAALERFFGQLDSTGLAAQSLVVLMADHSTGHSYVWGEPKPESDEQKARIPFVIVVPDALRARVKDVAALDAALADAQALMEQAPLSQNDVPSMLLALLSAHPSLKALPDAQRWHTLGGQVTSPYFDAGRAGASVIGVNGISEFFALNAKGERVGDYEDSVFLKTRADRYRVTPSLIPVTATLQTVLPR